MIHSIPKVSVGKSNQLKKKVFNFKNDNSTTFCFGMLQPLFCKGVEPRTHVSILNHNFVRFAAMHSPTFGRLTYRTYKRFVPSSDVWEPYDDFKAQTPYNNGNTSYVPDFEPNISIADLSKLCLYERSIFSVYSVSDFEDGSYDVDLVSAEGISDFFADLGSDDKLVCLNRFALINLSQTAGGKYIYFRTGDDAVTIEGADFIIEVSDSNDRYLVAFKLSWAGQQLFKTLVGCGFQFNFVDKSDISIMPFVSYYKAYYDSFAVQRNSNWNNTSCAKLMRYLANNPQYICISRQTPSNDLYTMIRGAFNEIGTTYYSADPDYVSAHTRDLSSDQPSMYVPYAQDAATFDQVGFTGDATDQVRIINDGDDSLGGLSRVGLQLLNKLAVRVNKHTAFGRRLDLILSNLFGAAYHHRFRTNNIGSQITNCVMGDVMATSDTASNVGGALLGEYAGKGIGMSDPNTKPDHFTADTWGYVIVMACIVPDAGYCQALDADLLRISKDSQYQNEFDAVGLEATPKSAIFGDYGVCVSDPVVGFADYTNTFGFIPRYTSKKIVTNKINGMLALRSTRKSYLGFTLDRYLTPPDVVEAGADYDGMYRNDLGVYYSMIAGIAWRYLCANGVTSNFNRIFYNTNEHHSGEFIPEMNIYDNFIVHNHIEIEADAPMISISDAFDTDAFEDNAMEVEKA